MKRKTGKSILVECKDNDGDIPVVIVMNKKREVVIHLSDVDALYIARALIDISEKTDNSKLFS